jgi:hypothetical protein
MTTEKYICKYCNKDFRKESSLLVHHCEPKRRAMQENDTGVRFGFNAYLQFYTATQGSATKKTYVEFSSSPYYSSFVKFGQYLVQIRAINIPMFTTWLLKNQKKLDSWTKDEYYDEYLYEYLRKEHPNDALDRTFTEMQKWADEHDTTFNTIFNSNVSGTVCNMILNGRISPWVLFNCDSGVKLLSELSNEQINLIIRWIDPDYWQRRFKDFMPDTEFIKSVTLESGL